MFDPDFVVAVLARIRLPQPELLVRPAEVDDLLGSPVARKPRFLTKAERAEDREIEGERPLNVANRQVDVMDRAGRQGQAPRVNWAADSRISVSPPIASSSSKFC